MASFDDITTRLIDRALDEDAPNKRKLIESVVTSQNTAAAEAKAEAIVRVSKLKAEATDPKAVEALDKVFDILLKG